MYNTTRFRTIKKHISTWPLRYPIQIIKQEAPILYPMSMSFWYHCIVHAYKPTETAQTIFLFSTAIFQPLYIPKIKSICEGKLTEVLNICIRYIDRTKAIPRRGERGGKYLLSRSIIHETNKEGIDDNIHVI